MEYTIAAAGTVRSAKELKKMTNEVEIIFVIREIAMNLWALGVTAGAVLYLINRLWRGKIAAKEALLILQNVLTDSKKMTGTECGYAYSPDVLDKIDKVGDIIGASTAAKDIVKNQITEVNKDSIGRPSGFWKIGSYKGEPIYASDIFSIAGKLKALFKF